MASSTTSILTEFSGKLGEQFVLKRYGNKTVLCSLPQRDSSQRRTEKQLQNNQLMAAANKLALATIDNPAQRDAAMQVLNVTRNKLYTSLVRLYFQQVREAKAKGEDIPTGIRL